VLYNVGYEMTCKNLTSFEKLRQTAFSETTLRCGYKSRDVYVMNGFIVRLNQFFNHYSTSPCVSLSSPSSSPSPSPPSSNPSTVPTQQASDPKEEEGLSTGVKAGIACAVIAAVVVLVAGILIYRKRQGYHVISG
jgi:hypothetical protein